MANNEEVTPLHSASGRGYEGVVRALVEDSCATLNTPDVSHSTPLHSACARGQRSTCEVLLAHGADITAITEELRTPFHEAVLSGKADVVEDLIKAGKRSISAPSRAGMRVGITSA